MQGTRVPSLVRELDPLDLDFPGGSDGKAFAYNVEDPGSTSWVRKIFWRRKWQPTPVLLPGESHGWRNLVGNSPWGHKESDLTERLHFPFFLLKILIVRIKPKVSTVSYDHILRGHISSEMRAQVVPTTVSLACSLPATLIIPVC